MSTKGSVFQKGGGGTNFEQAVQAAFLTTLIIRGNAPSIPPNELIEVAFQTTNLGYETDDLLAIAKSQIGQHRLLAQIKHNLTFSVKNETFQEVIDAFWKDFINPSIFDKTRDRLLIIKNGLTKDERNHIKSLLNWAKTHNTEISFFSEVHRIQAKRERLEIFQNCLKKANSNKICSDKEVYDFLKCLDVLEYDFTNETSVDETNFLNLIKLSKGSSSGTTEKEIWDSITTYVSRLNKDGGNVTIESIQKEDLFKHFNPEKITPYFKSIEKLRSDSDAILKPIKNTIGTFHLDRKSTYESIAQSINGSQFTIITGKPGVGKSAAVKDILLTEYHDSSVFVFRADQFNAPHISNVFTNQGINDSIADIFSCISLIPEKFIVIDSLEKLLEGDPENAFKQLLSIITDYPDLKIIATARRYSIDLIYQKFGINSRTLEVVDIPPLNKEELKIISNEIPLLKTILANNKLQKLLESPKYLDFSISALSKFQEDFTNTSLKEFKEKLWNTLVKDSTNRTKGYPAKREDAFLSIAVKRAKEMKLFVKPDHVDEEAIDLLENDELIFQENQNRRYSPSHDILEDWALVYYVSSKYDDFPKPQDLFEEIGNEPAIRRAFRLWVEDEILDDSGKINELIKASLNEGSIPKYWADEILVAIFKSDDCALFFKTFEKELLESDATLLNRCIHLIRTACKESNLESSNFDLLLPIGSGWEEVISFIKLNLSALNNIRLSISNLLYDWEYRLLFQNAIDNSQTENVKIITSYYIDQIESGDEFWEMRNVEDKKTHFISLLFNLSNIAKEEITNLIGRAFKAKTDHSNWKLNSFYESVIDSCLSGLNTKRLTNELPELVVESAWREWKLKKPEIKPSETDLLGIYRGNRLRDDECWGIHDKHSFFPSGIYKTPLLNLLNSNPLIGLKFVTEFINYSIDFYVAAKCDYKHKITQTEIELNDGTIVKQWAAWELWAAYRGISVTHYAIESLLMSLEKYLLETAKIKSEISRKNLQFVFNHLLRTSNNVAITSVLTSVAIAYPEEVGEEILPLIGVQEFYEWDLSRSLQEHSALAPMDNRISFAQKVRSKSNQLPHRKKYSRGLRDFVIHYQFNIGALNIRFQEIFDKLKSKLNESDVLWKKLLIEIDIRKHKIGEYDEKLGGFPIQPEYDDEVTEFMTSNEDFFTNQSIAINYSSLLKKAYDNEERISIEKLQGCFDQYLKMEQYDQLYDRPVTLAFVGLRDYQSNLNKVQIHWCTKTLLDSILEILKDEFTRNYGLNRKVNLMEKEIALSSFHLLFDNTNDLNERNELTAVMIYMLFAPFADHEVDKIIEYVRNTFFKAYPDIGKRVWIGLIKYSEFRKSNPYFYDHRDEEKLKAIKNKEADFIDNLVTDKDIEINLSKVSLTNSEGYLLTRAFCITPYHIVESLYSDYINHFIPLLTEDLKVKESYSYQRNEDSRQIHFESVWDAKLYLVELLLNGKLTLIKQVMDLVIDPIHVMDSSQWNSKKDLLEFSRGVLELSIYKLDELISNSDNAEHNQQLISNFWNAWHYLFDKIMTSNKSDFTKTLLLDIKWRSESTHWKALVGEESFYHNLVKEFGHSNSQAVLNILSTIGEQSFLPNALTWLVDIYKNDSNGNQTMSLLSNSANRLIKRLFYNHISAIKRNKTLIDDFIWLLNKMVDMGSSDAYFFRENFITYKNYG